MKLKPLFVLYVNIKYFSTNEEIRKYWNLINEICNNKLGKDYNVLVIPLFDDQKTYYQVFYTKGSKETKIEDFIKELTQKVTYKNVRIKLNNGII